LPSNDVWLAATAMQHGLRVLTLDRHFLDIPQVLVELFEPG
jgi:predicted nucleic acid-binding protein